MGVAVAGEDDLGPALSGLCMGRGRSLEPSRGLTGHTCESANSRFRRSDTSAFTGKAHRCADPGGHNSGNYIEYFALSRLWPYM
jgi:hypothetical protein